MEKNFAFMAFGTGKESTDAVEVKRYIGVAPVYVLAVNPNKAQLEKIYGITIENDPNYISESEVDGKKVISARIDFVVKTDAEHCNGIDYTTKVSFFIRKEMRYNRDKTKVQVIDKYGRTAWVTIEQAKNHEIPVYSNGNPANIDKDYRPAYVGEEDLTNFLKTYLGIPLPMKYVNNQWVMADNLPECEARLESIDKYFKGDFSELKNILALQPKNRVKVLFGVKTSDDNKIYQAVYTQKFLRNNVSKYESLVQDLEARKSSGAYPTTEFKVCDLREYTVEATNFSTKDAGDMPFEQETQSETPWDFGN